MPFVAILFLLPASACKPEKVIERDGLVYGRTAGQELRLDLAMPKTGAGPFPAVIFLHGQGWRAGSRQDMSHFITGMARMGYVGVTVEYRLVPVPLDQSKRMATRLNQSGVAARLVILPGEGHGFTDAKNQDAMRQMLDFLGEHLRRRRDRLNGKNFEPRSAKIHVAEHRDGERLPGRLSQERSRADPVLPD
jgi:acetyl esterase/lipase